MEKINNITKWFQFSNKIQKIEEKLEDTIKNTGHTMSLKEFSLLYYLSTSEYKSMRLQSLPDLIGLSQSALSRLVARMEESSCGVIKKISCEEDKRGVYISLTEKGEEIVKIILKSLQKVLDNVNLN
ncbi:MAG: MarR family winged helix-turn-helix transcriptional regulator [Fusobacterium polymorphum]